MKNGFNNFYIETLEKVDNCKTKFDIMAIESKYIKALKPNLNMHRDYIIDISSNDSNMDVQSNDNSTNDINIDDQSNDNSTNDYSPNGIDDNSLDKCYYSKHAKDTCLEQVSAEVRFNNKKKAKQKVRLVCSSCCRDLAGRITILRIIK